MLYNERNIERRMAMRRLVEFDLGDGKSIWIEANESESEVGTERAGRLGEMLQKVKAKVPFDEALNTACFATEKVITKLQGLSKQPNEVEMEFGFNFNADVGIYIGSVSAGTNYKVTMRWARHTQEDT